MQNSELLSMSSKSVPVVTIVPQDLVTFTYKYDQDGHASGHKASFSYLGNRLIPRIHYNSQEIAVYSSDRDAIILVLEVSARLQLSNKNIEFKSDFLM